MPTDSEILAWILSKMCHEHDGCMDRYYPKCYVSLGLYLDHWSDLKEMIIREMQREAQSAKRR